MNTVPKFEFEHIKDNHNWGLYVFFQPTKLLLITSNTNDNWRWRAKLEQAITTSRHTTVKTTTRESLTTAPNQQVSPKKTRACQKLCTGSALKAADVMCFFISMCRQKTPNGHGPVYGPETIRLIISGRELTANSHTVIIKRQFCTLISAVLLLYLLTCSH